MAVLQAGYDAFQSGDFQRSMLHYMQAAEMGLELGQSNAAWLLSQVRHCLRKSVNPPYTRGRCLLLECQIAEIFTGNWYNGLGFKCTHPSTQPPARPCFCCTGVLGGRRGAQHSGCGAAPAGGGAGQCGGAPLGGRQLLLRPGSAARLEAGRRGVHRRLQAAQCTGDVFTSRRSFSSNCIAPGAHMLNLLHLCMHGMYSSMLINSFLMDLLFLGAAPPSPNLWNHVSLPCPRSACMCTSP